MSALVMCARLADRIRLKFRRIILNQPQQLKLPYRVTKRLAFLRNRDKNVTALANLRFDSQGSQVAHLGFCGG